MNDQIKNITTKFLSKLRTLRYIEIEDGDLYKLTHVKEAIDWYAAVYIYLITQNKNDNNFESDSQVKIATNTFLSKLGKFRNSYLECGYLYNITQVKEALYWNAALYVYLTKQSKRRKRR